MHTHHKSTTRISRLKCPNGSYTTDLSQMRQVAFDYYDNFFLKSRSFSKDDLFKRNIIWSRIQNRVFVQLSERLLQPLSPQEVLKAAKAIPTDVCPGLDGLGA